MGAATTGGTFLVVAVLDDWDHLTSLTLIGSNPSAFPLTRPPPPAGSAHTDVQTPRTRWFPRPGPPDPAGPHAPDPLAPSVLTPPTPWPRPSSHPQPPDPARPAPAPGYSDPFTPNNRAAFP